MQIEAPAYAREVDNLVGWNIDKINRSMKGSVNLAAKLEARRGDPQSLTDGINTNRAASRFFGMFFALLLV